MLELYGYVWVCTMGEQRTYRLRSTDRLSSESIEHSSNQKKTYGKGRSADSFGRSKNGGNCDKRELHFELIFEGVDKEF